MESPLQISWGLALYTLRFAIGVGLGRIYFTVLRNSVSIYEWVTQILEKYGLGFTLIWGYGALDGVVVEGPGWSRRVEVLEASSLEGFALVSPRETMAFLWVTGSSNDGNVVAGRLRSGRAQLLYVFLAEMPGHHEAWRLVDESFSSKRVEDAIQ